jgi:hypothetical protein
MSSKKVQVSGLTFSRVRLTFYLTFFGLGKVSRLTFYDHPVLVRVAASGLAPLHFQMTAPFEQVQQVHHGALGHADACGDVFA